MLVVLDAVQLEQVPRDLVVDEPPVGGVLDGKVLGSGRTLQYAGRPESASPAAGSLKVHLAEQDALVKQALG